MSVASEILTPAAQSGSFSSLLKKYFVAIHVPNFFQATSIGIRSMLVPVFASSLGCDDTTISMITSVAGIGRVSMAFPGGAWTEKYGSVVVMVAGMTVNVLGAVIAYFATGPVVLYLSSVIFGAGIGLYYVSRALFLSHVVEKSIRGRLMSLVASGDRWASVFGPLYGGFVVEYLGMRMCWLAIVPTLAICIAATLRSSVIRTVDAKICPADVSKSESTAQSRAGGCAGQWVRETVDLIVEHREILQSLGVYAMNIISLRNCYKLLLPLAALHMNASPTVVGSILAFSFIVDAAFSFLGGVVSDRYGRRMAAVPTSVNLGIAFFLLSVCTNTWSLFAVAAAFGLADSLGAGLLLALAADSVPKKASGRFVGMLRFMQDSGQFVGPMIVALLTKFFSFELTCCCVGIIGIANGWWAWASLPDERRGLGDSGVPVALPVAVETPSATTTSIDCGEERGEVAERRGSFALPQESLESEELRPHGEHLSPVAYDVNSSAPSPAAVLTCHASQ
jgi:MFS family permease